MISRRRDVVHGIARLGTAGTQACGAGLTGAVIGSSTRNETSVTRKASREGCCVEVVAWRSLREGCLMVAEAEVRTNEREHKMMVERVQCVGAGVDALSPAMSPAMLIGEARFVDGGSAQRNDDAGAGFTDGGRVARARRVLVMAETLAWAGLGTKLSGEEVAGGKPKGKAENEAGHDKTPGGRQQKPASRIRRGKKQRAQQ